MTQKPDLDSAYALASPADNARFYEAWAEDYDQAFVTNTSYQLPALVAACFLDGMPAWPCLDVGCGTGAVGAALANAGPIDGLDLSPQMLDVARRTGAYRSLIAADLTAPLPIDSARYAGLLSAGTFTHGHVGAEALNELVRILAPGGRAVLTVKPEIWDDMGFGPGFEALRATDQIADFACQSVPVYSDPKKAPAGHANDQGFLVTFRKR